MLEMIFISWDATILEIIENGVMDNEYLVAQYPITPISLHNALFLEGVTRTGPSDLKEQPCEGKGSKETFEILMENQL